MLIKTVLEVKFHKYFCEAEFKYEPKQLQMIKQSINT